MSASRRSKKASKSSKRSEQDMLHIPDEEQWRLVNESGILKKLEVPKPKFSQDQTEEPLPLGEEIFNATMLIVPFCFLLLMMDILIHRQYGQEPVLRELVERMMSGIPILSLFVFYTTRHKEHRKMQILLFILAVLAGCRMIFIINHSSWLTNIRQCPPLATLWIYTIVQLELGPAVLSLLTFGSFVWWKGLRLSF
ncbi:hypothetical protein AMATHDRAFT_74986 [Amanita thiersii Skay4041]|uniref:DUF7719 domain-containing protein n=1 Tax=Amanita thiersii Skay4041 TaxID=703135 RepID=A0A2A9NLM1_9AGAR|nr:hypothetical protein AMATHDRAFT_74986 [Amanita thiersii Skay4041]